MVTIKNTNNNVIGA